MKIISFNVNSIRARQHQLQAVVDAYAPDFLGLQETKVPDEEFPIEEVESLGYGAIYHGQKTHYGVALLYRKSIELKSSLCGFPADKEDAQKRFVSGTFSIADGQSITVINGYFPQGESRKHPTKFPDKEKFYADLLQHLQDNHSPDELIYVVGDMNVAPVDEDIGIGDNNKKRWLRDGKTSFLPEEREWLGKLTEWGLTDQYRHHHPDSDDRFSWFDYRSRGFERDPKRGLRIDLILASKGLIESAVDSGIDYDIRAMEKPSDHCPIWAESTLSV